MHPLDSCFYLFCLIDIQVSSCVDSMTQWDVIKYVCAGWITYMLWISLVCVYVCVCERVMCMCIFVYEGSCVCVYVHALYIYVCVFVIV